MLNVDGMKCGGCSAAVKRILMTNPGVNSAAVNLLTECAVVQLDSGNKATSADDLASSLSSKVGPDNLSLLTKLQNSRSEILAIRNLEDCSESCRS